MNKDQDDNQTSVIKTKMDKRKKSDAEYQTIQLTEAQDPENPDAKSKEQSTVVDWNESTEQTEERVHAQPGRMTIGQMLVKKLRKPKKSSMGPEGSHSGGSAGSSPTTTKKKTRKLPAISDFVAPENPLKDEYYFDDWNDKCLTPEFHEHPKKLHFVSDSVQVYSHRYVGEALVVVQAVAEFFVSLVLEVLAFSARIASRLVSGTLARVTELILKPILVIVFNGIILPVFVTVQNIFKATGAMLNPLLDLLQRCVGIATIPIQAFRLVEIRYVTETHPPAEITKVPQVEEV